MRIDKVKSNDRITRRIKALLSLAEDKSNVNESHLAFLQAQQMMIKYGVDPSELTDDDEVKEILEKSGTDYKRLYWYERKLANTVAKNFRCKNFIRWKHFKGKVQKQSRIEFMGLESDVELASAMYRLVISAIEFYAHKHIKENGLGVRHHTQSLKDDYMRGFIDGLERKFEEQIHSQEWGLILVIPKEVEERYSAEITEKGRSYSIPPVETQESYKQGYKEGNAIDYKKETIQD